MTVQAILEESDLFYVAPLGESVRFEPVGGDISGLEASLRMTRQDGNPWEILVENRGWREIDGVVRMLIPGTGPGDSPLKGGRRIRVSPGCAELVTVRQVVRARPQADALARLLGDIDPPEDALTDEQAYWYGFPELGGVSPPPITNLDHWNDTRRDHDRGGRRHHFPFPMVTYAIVKKKVDSGRLPPWMLDASAYYAHAWTIEQLVKRPDTPPVRGGWHPDTEVSLSWRGYIWTDAYNATIDLLVADAALTGSPLAYARIEDILQRVVVEAESSRDGRTCANVARCCLLSAALTDSDNYVSFARELLGRPHDRLGLTERSLLANAGWWIARISGQSDDTALARRLTEDLIEHHVEGVTEDQVRGDQVIRWYKVVDSLVRYGWPRAAELWSWMANSSPSRRHWAERGTRYMLRYCPFAMQKLGLEEWPESQAGFPYRREYPNPLQPQVF